MLLRSAPSQIFERGEKVIERAVVIDWVCQHGTKRQGYVRPAANCAKCKLAPCVWKEKA
jgi:hypothetical protein